MHCPPPPPPEFEPDGSPKKYPLYQPVWDHGYEWEQWSLLPAGVFHTVYEGHFAQDFPPYWAWLQSYPKWMVTPILVTMALIIMVIFQNGGSVGIKPKRYTIEWVEATKERERIENTNPVTRYLDRRKHERSGNWLAQYALPWHPYWVWMTNAHDPDFPEYYRKTPGAPSIHWTDNMTVSFKKDS
jgi:hypothetical protein